MLTFNDFLQEKSRAELKEDIFSQLKSFTEHVTNWLCSDTCENGNFYNWDNSILQANKLIHSYMSKIKGNSQDIIQEYINVKLTKDLSTVSTRLTKKNMKCNRLPNSLDFKEIITSLLESNPSSRQEVQQFMMNICNKLSKEHQ